jgi:predicted phage baseplate assembly protein
MMLELVAYVGDITNYYIDQSKQEAYLPTATQRQSVLNIAEMLGYLPHTGIPATSIVTLQTDTDYPATVVPIGTQLVTEMIDDLDAQVVFETTAAVTVPAAGGTVDVPVREGQTHADISLGTSTGQPDQAYRLPHTNVYSDGLSVTVNSEIWNYVPHLLDADPQDRAFSTRLDAQGGIWLLFGDDVNGAVPAIGMPITVTYRSGYGIEGNVGAGVITQLAGFDPAGVHVATDSSDVPLSTVATGGADPESTEQVRSNAPRSYRIISRAITAQDFEDLALTVPGVIRASAIADFHTSVTVYILGPGGRAPNNDLLTRTLRSLSAQCLAGTTVTIAGPTFVAVNLGSVATPVTIEVWPSFKNATVKFAAEQAIRTLLDPANVDFGTRLTLSDFFSALISVQGVRYIGIPMFARSDAPQSGTADIVCKPWEFPNLGTLQIVVSGGVS